METTKVTIEATVSASPAKVWEYWTKPECITKWNFASVDWCCPSAENDLKVGGKYKARMEARDGSFGFDFEAIYDEIILQNKISYTMGDGRIATTQFEETNGGTKVTTTFDAETENPIEMQRDGWQAILDNFKKYTETN